MAVIELARVKILQNASDLLEEAELLRAAGRHARAFALAHLASEEVTKIPMLVSAALQVALGHEIDPERLTKRFQSHEEKILAAKIYDVSGYEPRPNPSQDTKLLPTKREIVRANALKNRSLYCGFHGSSFQAPSDVVTAQMASVAVIRARTVVEFFRLAESVIAGHLEEAVADPGVLQDVEAPALSRSRRRERRR